MFASVTIPLPVMADDDTAIKIIGTSGGAQEFSINNVGKITFQDETFTFSFTDGVTENMIFWYDEVKRMEFTDIATGIDNVTQEYNEDEIAISFDGSTLFISGCAVPSQMQVYDISGRPVMKRMVHGVVKVSVGNLSSGVYILKLNDKNFKFNIR